MMDKKWVEMVDKEFENAYSHYRYIDKGYLFALGLLIAFTAQITEYDPFKTNYLQDKYKEFCKKIDDWILVEKSKLEKEEVVS